MTFDELYEKAKSVLNPRQLSDSAEAGGVGAAILAASGRVYTGVCIDTGSSMGFCAEHAAAAAMITAGESRVSRMVAVGWDGRVMPPCGRCREFISQLHHDNLEAEVMVGEGVIVSLRDLLPYDWRQSAQHSIPTATPTATLEELLTTTPTPTPTQTPTTEPAGGPIDVQEGEGMTGAIKPGYPDSLPADEKSQTVLIVDIDPNAPCWNGPLDPSGTFYMEVSTSLGSVSPATVPNAHFPEEVVLTAGATPGQAVITVEITYCPPQGVMVYGVCSDPGPVEQRCVVRFTVDIN